MMRCLEEAEILREKGTDRSKFIRGQVDKYTWVDYGSSYLPSEMNAAYLWAQLESGGCRSMQTTPCHPANIMTRHLKASGRRKATLSSPLCPEYAQHNAHMYYIKVKDQEDQERS